MKRRSLAVLLLLLGAGRTLAATPDDAVLGRWLAEEPDAGTTTVVELYREGDTVAGRVVRIVDRHGAALAPVCAGCSGELRGRPLTGLRFLWNLHRADGLWDGGTVMDLRDGLTQGVTANAEISVHGDTLELHAYRGLRAFGQSRTWRRAPGTAMDGTSEPARQR
ncbi:DUF2147 domain-containing protein [Solimonas flava]|uniref:DUF2147 domain-containing protein n=1 Tax=Solimonas flava TaxID=415849 RepID=UPI00048861CA|nr:DUF2147 domain-containing protein [Solimonas flava]